jgi:DNA polymerase III epsilon subunit-like protein
MMKILFFDTETTGIPKDYNAPVADTDNWPRLVSISWIQHVGDRLHSTHDYIIKPKGFSIPQEASNIHGITTENAINKGFDLGAVLTVFAKRVREADLIVGHNISFDRKIVGAELCRLGIKDTLHGKERICTMFKSIKFCNIPGKYGRPKCPQLQELHVKLFGEEFAEAHSSLADIQATARCFFALVEKGVIELPQQTKEG